MKAMIDTFDGEKKPLRLIDSIQETLKKNAILIKFDIGKGKKKTEHHLSKLKYSCLDCKENDFCPMRLVAPEWGHSWPVHKTDAHIKCANFALDK